MADYELFQVGQKAILIRGGKALILEASYRPGFWDLPGGRIHAGEDGDAAFRRELKEETGLERCTSLGAVDYALWVQKQHPSVCLVVRLVENDIDPIVISAEHSQYRWISPNQLDQYRFVSDDMKRMLEKGFSYYTLRHAR